LASAIVAKRPRPLTQPLASARWQFVAALLVVCTPGASATRLSVSPVQKVLTLLDNLEAKIVKDGEAEQKAYVAYVDWCQNGAKEKEYEIKTAKASIEDLGATIEKAKSDIVALSSKVEDLGASISANDADLKAATTIREKELKEFVATQKELDDAINTLERAINILERRMHGSAMLQAQVSRRDIRQVVRTLSTIVDAAALSIHDKQKLLGLVQSSDEEDDDDDAFGAPMPEVYKSRSESITDVLEDLKQKAVAQLQDVRREEMNAKHNFELMRQSLQDQLKVDNKDIGVTKGMMQEATETKAEAVGEFQVTQKDLEDAQAFLKDTKRDCMTRASDHETSVRNRAEELKAIKGAKKAISENLGGAASLVYNSTSFLQVHGSELESSSSHLQTRADLANFEVVNLVRKLAREQKSTTLAQLAGRISAIMREGATSGGDPFAKVKAMISDMIERLLRDAGEEANHKEYCDKEMAGTKQKMGELKYEIQKHSAKIDKSSSRSIELKDEVATLAGEIADITRSQSEADSLRKAEHAMYVQAKADLEQGLEGVRMALKMLREYYASAPDAGASSLVQQPAQPELHSMASGVASTIIGMLEVVESDLGRGLASAEMSEEAAATTYERLGMDNRVSKAIKEKDVKYKTKEAASLDKSASELASDRDGLQTELDAVLQYSVSIRGTCEARPETFEDRKNRREAEIAGLQQALQILDGEAMFFQRRNRRTGLRGAAAAAA